MAKRCSLKVRSTRCLPLDPQGPVTRSRASMKKRPLTPHLRPRTASRRLKKETVVKILTDIDDHAELITAKQSTQSQMRENITNVDKSTLHRSCKGKSIAEWNESSGTSSKGKTNSLKNSDTTSGTTESVGSLDSRLSPEEFRGAEEFSEPPSKDNHVAQTVREQLKEPSETAQHVSTVVTGKKVFRLVSAREKTAECSALERTEKKMKELLKQTVKSIHVKCKKKVKFSSHLDSQIASCDYGQMEEEGSSLCTGMATEQKRLRTPDPPMHTNSSLYHIEENRQVLTSTPLLFREDLVMDLSPVCATPLEEELMRNTTGPFVRSNEIVPASSSSDEFNYYQELFKTLDLCSIIRTPGPELPPRSAKRVPVNEHVWNQVKKLPKDYILRLEEEEEIV
ncbi:uncharacterized protein LOC115079873 isoform X1 [Rhinatrema bivittatum]|uniref:uncharacterized protein LOC115079873 isoform X1 n=1 Tax=Rhinatrema bivittatum TaxID=194408 RepID=UPI00112BC28D|nr:uncharacterized protein LOC115079873 isoform X1 [Rhinatrema bivittatum]